MRGTQSVRISAWQRRLMTVPAVIGGFIVLVPALIVLLPAALLHDLVRGRRLSTVRMLAFGTCYLGWEVIAIGASFGLWVGTGFGLFTGRPFSVRAHRRLQAR